MQNVASVLETVVGCFNTTYTNKLHFKSDGGHFETLR